MCKMQWTMTRGGEKQNMTVKENVTLTGGTWSQSCRTGTPAGLLCRGSNVNTSPVTALGLTLTQLDLQPLKLASGHPQTQLHFPEGRTSNQYIMLS